MKHLFQKLAMITVLVAVSTGAFAGVGGTGAVSSDYVFRGISQNDDIAVSGSFNYDHDSGVYAGVWGSQIDYSDDSSIEHDIYMGWAGKVGSLDLDVAYIDYNYNGDMDLDGSEIMVSGELKGLRLSYFMGRDNYEDYMEVGYTIKGVDVSYGMWDNIGDNFKVSKGFNLPRGLQGDIAYVNFSADNGSSLDDENQIVVSVSKSF
mgnify:CR=1 FL=1|jgi:uncharacterized protein (TIGR02001 family)